jgi:hypothetical protein
MNVCYKIIICILLYAAPSLYGQGKWVRYITRINGSIPVSGKFLNETFGIAETATAWFRTDDGGKTWTPCTGLPVVTASHLNIYYYTPSNIFVNGRFESKDSGRTWTPLKSPAFSNSIYIHDSVIYDAFGRKSSDHANSWQVIPGASIGESVTGNLDSAIALWDVKTAYSTNGGISWQSGQAGVEADYSYAIPFTKFFFRSGGDGSDAIQRSIDGGKTWQTVFGTVGSRYLTDGIDGDGCIVFAQTMGTSPGYPSGVIRSTDQGSSWIGLGGPMNLDDYPLCGVTSRGTTCFAMGSDGSGIWKWTDSAAVRSIRNDANISRFFPDLITMQDCDTLNLGLQIDFNSCDFIRLHNITVDNLSPLDYKITFRKDHAIHSGSPENPVITIFPTAPGTYNLLIHINLAGSDWNGIDTTFPVTLIVRSFTPKLVVSPDSINFGTKPICFSGGKDTIRLSNPSCEKITITDIRLETDTNSVNDFALSKTLPYTLSSRMPVDKIAVDYHPLTTGIKTGKIIIVSDIGIDTIPLYADVLPDSSYLKIQNSKIVDFGTMNLCLAGGADTLTLSNPGCTQVKIKNVYFESDPLTQADYSLRSAGTTILNMLSATHKLYLNFHPQGAGLKNGKIIIETNLGFDTILVLANILPDARILQSRCDDLSAPLCDSANGFVHLRNSSCRDITLDTISFPLPYRLLPVRLPLLIRSGDSVLLPIRFIPLQHGLSAVTAKATLSFYQPSRTDTYDTNFVFNGFGEHGASAYLLSENSAQFDTTHLCDTAKRKIIVYSTGCDSLDVSKISVTGDADFSSIISSPVTIATGDSLILDITLKPNSLGNKSASITIMLPDSSKLQVPISATIIRGRRDLVCSASGIIDFGKQFTCDDTNKVITLSNPGCDTIHISKFNWQGSGFGSDAAFPIILLPGQQKDITVTTVLDTAGGNASSTSALTYTSDADNQIPSITFSRSYIYPHSVHLWLSGDMAPISSSGIWKVKLKARPDEITDVKTISFDLDYNADLLYFSQNKSSIISADGKSFSLSGISASADSTIGEMSFQVYLTKDSTTDLVMKNITLNSSDSKFMNCAAIPLASSASFTYFNNCGDRSIRKGMTGKQIISSIHPNPAVDEMVIDIQSPVNQQTFLEIFNTLGQRVLSQEVTIVRGFNSTHIDIHNLGEGIYFLRMADVSASFVKIK